MRTLAVVIHDPHADGLLRMVETKTKSLVEQFVAHSTIKALDEAVLHRLARRDEMPVDFVVLAPGQHGVTGEFGSVVADDHPGLGLAPLDDSGQFTHHTTPRDGRIGNRAKTFLGDVVDHV